MPQAEVLAWIETAAPEQLYCVATKWLWDYGVDILQKIVDQERCEASTAIAIFFRGEPGHYANADDRKWAYTDDAGTFALLKSISARLASGFYGRPQFEMDWTAYQICHVYNGDALATYGPGSYWNLPDWVFEKPAADLKKIDCTAYDEGRPPELSW